MWTAEEKSLLWLDSFSLEPIFKHALLTKAGGAAALVRSFRRFEQDFPDRSTFEKMAATLQDGAYFATVAARLEKEKITPIFYGENGYPKGWLSLTDAPLCLYAKGKTEFLESPFFAVVGSRRTTESAKKLGKRIAQELTERFAVITGSADGGDEAALSGALDGGKAICFLAGGFGVMPKENPLLSKVEKEGLLLAACPLDTPVRVYSYEYRNKLLAACAEGVLVLGAAQKSGALITAKYAKELQKKLFAIPYAPSVAAGEGCNRLIKDGAFLTESAEDVFEQYGYSSVQKPKIVLTEMEEKAVQFLAERGESHVAEIASALGVPIFRLTTLLAALEIKGVAVMLGGNRYTLV